MNDAVFNPSQCSYGVLDKECDLNSDEECEASECCATEPAPTTCTGSYNAEPLGCHKSCGGNPCKNANSVLDSSGGEVVNRYCREVIGGDLNTCCVGSGC